MTKAQAETVLISLGHLYVTRILKVSPCGDVWLIRYRSAFGGRTISAAVTLPQIRDALGHGI